LTACSFSKLFAATVMNKLCPYVLLVELLGPGNPVDDRLCSGLSWALLTAAFLRDADTIKAVLDRSCGTDLSESLLNTALEVAVLQGDFEAVGMFLPRNTGPNKTGSCKGHQSTNGGALRQACTAGHESIVDLLLQPCYGIKKNGLPHEEAVSQAARGRGEGRGHAKITRSLLANGEPTDLAQLRYNIIGEARYWGSEDIVRMVLQDQINLNVLWEGRMAATNCHH
jgi:hypothetical protein